MPMYKYYCPICKEAQEIFRHTPGQVKAICPKCKKKGEIVQLKIHKDSFLTAKPLAEHDQWFKHD